VGFDISLAKLIECNAEKNPVTISFLLKKGCQYSSA